MPPVGLQALLKRKREEQGDDDSVDPGDNSNSSGSDAEPENAEESIEDRIKRLEAELEGDDSCETEEDTDEEDDAIAPLPAHQLPGKASKRKLKQHRAEAESGMLSLNFTAVDIECLWDLRRTTNASGESSQAEAAQSRGSRERYAFLICCCRRLNTVRCGFSGLAATVREMMSNEAATSKSGGSIYILP